MNNFLGIKIEDWMPMLPQMGPPLPKSMEIYWPWYTPPEEVPPEAPIYACPYCEAEFSTQAELFAHIVKAHAGQPPKIIYMCPICGAKFDTMTELTEHIARVHPPAKVYTCPYCGATFATEAELNYHIQLVHPTVPPVVFTCTICGATFATQAELDYHMATVHPEVADIRVESLTIEPSEVYVGDQVTISVVTKNYGDASGSKTITCNVNGKVTSQAVELSPGQSRWVTFEATPQEARTYQVSVNGLTGTFRAIAKAVAKFYMPARMEVSVTDGSILDMYWKCDFSCPVTNKGNATGTHTVSGKDNLGRTWGPIEVTLAPGETYVCKPNPGGPNWIDFRRIAPPYIWELTGDWEGDNYSKGEARP